MKKMINNVYEITPLLKAMEVANILNISKSLVYRLIQTGEIAHIQINNAVRIHHEDLHKYIETNRIEPSSFSKTYKEVN